MLSSSLLTSTLPSLFLLLTPTLASTCRNISITLLSQDGPSQFSNTNVTPLENVNCPQSNNASAVCSVPRGTYDIVVHRTLNISTTPEDEDAIFTIVQAAFINRTIPVGGIAINASLKAAAPWIDLPRTVDTTDSSWSKIFFETKAGLNYTLGFLAFTRWGHGTLSGCDNETLNGVGVQFAAPYETVNEDKGNITEVAGNLYGSGRNTSTDNDNAAGRLSVGSRGAGLMVLMGLGSVFAMAL